MYIVAHILKALPDVKVIYSLRDPRGIINSRRRIKKSIELVSSARHLCLRQSQDYTIFHDLERAFPGRIMRITYEDLAAKPLELAETLYDFIGLPLPVPVSDWLNENTKTDDVPSMRNLYSTTRNSMAAATRWRSVLPENVIAQMSRVCERTLSQLGYEL